MPRGDKTGPRGIGPMTGRGMGVCNGYENQGFGRGLRRRFFWNNSQNPNLLLTEKEILKQELKQLETKKDYIKNRLQELEKIESNISKRR